MVSLPEFVPSVVLHKNFNHVVDTEYLAQPTGCHLFLLLVIVAIRVFLVQPETIAAGLIDCHHGRTHLILWSITLIQCSRQIKHKFSLLGFVRANSRFFPSKHFGFFHVGLARIRVFVDYLLEELELEVTHCVADLGVVAVYYTLQLLPGVVLVLGEDNLRFGLLAAQAEQPTQFCLDFLFEFDLWVYLCGTVYEEFA